MIAHTDNLLLLGYFFFLMEKEPKQNNTPEMCLRKQCTHDAGENCVVLESDCALPAISACPIEYSFTKSKSLFF